MGALKVISTIAGLLVAIIEIGKNADEIKEKFSNSKGRKKRKK